MGWAVFQTYGAQEKRAVDNLIRQGLTAFSPFIIKPPEPTASLRYRGPRHRPLFPCYGFVLLDDPAMWGRPDNTYGVLRLLTDRNRNRPQPLWVPDGYVASLSSLIGLTTEFVGTFLPLDTIVRVKTRSSPFYELVGRIVSMGKNDRIKVLMSLFNRDVVVEFDQADLEET